MYLDGKYYLKQQSKLGQQALCCFVSIDNADWYWKTELALERQLIRNKGPSSGHQDFFHRHDAMAARKTVSIFEKQPSIMIRTQTTMGGRKLTYGDVQRMADERLDQSDSIGQALFFAKASGKHRSTLFQACIRGGGGNRQGSHE
ncbi:hypothetical protein VTO42DRAFT_5764 [Malbranchea cinnamomea]